MPKHIRLVLLFISITLLLTACAAENSKALQPITPQQAAILYNPRGNTILGNPNGDVTLVVLFDYNCPYCRKMEPIIQQLVQQDPNLRVVFKEFLLFGPISELPTRAALAAQQQGKYLAMHNALMTANKPLDNTEIMSLAKSIGLNTKKLTVAMTSTAINNQINENNNLAQELNINGAPDFIFVNSKIVKNPQDTQTKQIMLMGATTLDQLQHYITVVRTN